MIASSIAICSSGGEGIKFIIDIAVHGIYEWERHTTHRQSDGTPGTSQRVLRARSLSLDRGSTPPSSSRSAARKSEPPEASPLPLAANAPSHGISSRGRIPPHRIWNSLFVPQPRRPRHRLHGCFSPGLVPSPHYERLKR